MTAGETLRQAFPDKSTPLVSYGLPFTEACLRHVNSTFHATRVYLIASASLSKSTTHVSDLQNALGPKLAKTRIGMTPHTLEPEVLEIVSEARSVDADCIVALGGGSLSDAAKLISFALANSVQKESDLDNLPQIGTPETEARPANPSKIPIICIPTSLSGGEYSVYAGVTNHVTKRKRQFAPPLASPSLIILSGNLATSTPLKLWLESGVRAIDHCVETLASLKSTPEVDENMITGLKCLIPGLLKTKLNPEDANARFDCQLGVMYVMLFLHRKVWCGASHGIGQMLGPLGNVGHGETSCILLPAVCKYNFMHGDEGVRQRQTVIVDALWGIEEARVVFERRGLRESECDAGDAIDAVVRELGLKRRLNEVGLGKDRFEELAENSLKDPFLERNPVPITKQEEVMENLEMCA